VGTCCDCFDVVCIGSSAIIKLCCYIVYFNHFSNHIGVATLRDSGAAVHSRYSNRAVGNSNKQCTQNNSQTSSLWRIYEANKDSET